MIPNLDDEIVGDADTVCTYERLDNGIHLLTVNESSRAAVDAMVGHIYRVLQTTPKHEPILYLADNSQVEALPLGDVARRIREVDESREPDREPGRIAVLYNGFMGNIANAMLKLAMKNEIRIFHSNDRQKAETWLLRAE